MMNRLEQENYDLILLDPNLGVEDGLDILRTLNPRRRSPIIVISGRKNPVDRVVGLELGADDYVCKTVSPSRSPGAGKEGFAPSKLAARHSCK
jgi:DNA-binding response OmpR family regulator